MPRGFTTLGLFFPPRVCSWDAWEPGQLRHFKKIWLSLSFNFISGIGSGTGTSFSKVWDLIHEAIVGKKYKRFQYELFFIL